MPGKGTRPGRFEVGEEPLQQRSAKAQQAAGVAGSYWCS